MISKLLVSGVFYLSRRRLPCVHKKLKIKKALEREDARQRAAWQLWKKYIQIVLKYWENDICIRCQWNISATFLTFWSIKGKNELGMLSEWKFFECITNKIWTQSILHIPRCSKISEKSIWQMLENVYTVSCKNKGVPFIRSAFLFAVFQFLTYIFQQKAPFPGAFCYEWKE